MVLDEVRMSAFERAITAAVRPGDVVLDIGAGTGIFALLACRQGARRVHAVDVNPLILDGVPAAGANGFADRIEFHHADVLDLTLPEPADVILGDIRGVLPGFDGALELYREVCARHLASGGRVIPQCDSVYAAPLSDAALYRDQILRPWTENDYGVDLSAHAKTIANTALTHSLQPSALVLEPQQPWMVLNYVTGTRTDSGPLRFSADEATTVHFVSLWFDTVLHGDIGYSNAPYAERRPSVYNQLLLPLEAPVRLEPTEQLELSLRSHPVAGDFVFSYSISVLSDDGTARQVLRQSTFESLPLQGVRRRAVDHVPQLGQEGLLLQRAFELLDGMSTVEAVAERLTAEFPDRLPGRARGLEFVADLSQRYGQ